MNNSEIELTAEEKAIMRKRPKFITKWEVSFFSPTNIYHKKRYGKKGDYIKADETTSLSTFIPCLIRMQTTICDSQWEAEYLVNELKKNPSINKIRTKVIKSRIYE